jgi:tRNA pseudouridine38-40 synthase
VGPAPDRERGERDAAAGATYRLTLAYLGAGYGGWQRQTNATGIQEVVESALERLVREPVRVVAASRTDAGVHAAGQEAHVRLLRSWPVRSLVDGANHFLPAQVRVLRAIPVAREFHARGWAVAKEYHYRMSRAAVLPPFEAPTTLQVSPRLDVDRLRDVARLLEGRHDWSAFARSGGSHHQPWRRMFRTEIVERDEALLFRIAGDGFLRGMVRAMVGTMLWVAAGRLSLDDCAALLDGAQRAQAGPTAPAHGLTLVRVFYPDEFAGF